MGAAFDPIDLADDGLRTTRVGEIGKGDLIRRARFICQHNPMLVAEAIATKAVRKAIREANERLFA